MMIVSVRERYWGKLTRHHILGLFCYSGKSPSSLKMHLSFNRFQFPHDQSFLIQWLVAEEWPFHVNHRLTPEKVSAMISGGTFDGSNHQSFWIDAQFEGRHHERIGMIRLIDIDDIGDGDPLFDIRIQSRYRGQGIGRQAVAWLTKYFFENWPELKRISGATRSDNRGMRRTFITNGYIKEGHFRQDWPGSDGFDHDSVLFTILRGDWQKKEITPLNWNDEIS
ncbi:MAG: GNAT family N-acetyltransferase [Bdellovibrio sp.]|nr:GNAT family N-acetyltransferase [Bdellovibrio sp.]